MSESALLRLRTANGSASKSRHALVLDHGCCLIVPYCVVCYVCLLAKTLSYQDKCGYLFLPSIAYCTRKLSRMCFCAAQAVPVVQHPNRAHSWLRPHDVLGLHKRVVLHMHAQIPHA